MQRQANQSEYSQREFLTVEGVTKRFGPLLALREVNFSARAGEIHALVGANGAGKSTLMNLLSGALTPSDGSIWLDGAQMRFASPSDAKLAGISTVYQEFSLIPQLTVARNIYLGREPRTRWHTVDESKLISDTVALLQLHDLDLNPHSEVQDLTVAQQQMVEIARALSFPSKVLILDEPSAVLSIAEQEKLFQIMRRLKERGTLILYVSHRLEEIISMADRLTVLRNGAMIGTHDVRSMTISDIVRLMIGGEAEKATQRTPPSSGAKNFTIRYRTVRGESAMNIGAGEIVGIAGLVGAGRTTFARALSGCKIPGTEVDFDFAEKDGRFSSPEHAVSRGVIYLTEDRKKDGIFSNLDLVRNASASSLGNYSGRGILRRRDEKRSVEAVLKRLRLVARDLTVPISTLSGGNQQKVIFGRAILTGPKVLIVDEPTRGVDVGAKAEIHSILREVADQGCAVIVISSEIDELLVTCSRIVVMRDYMFLQEFGISEADEHTILEVASSGMPRGPGGPNQVH